MGCAFFISIQFTLTFLHVVAIFYVQRKLNFYNATDSPSVVTVILPILTYSLSIIIGWSSVALSRCFYLKSICCNSGKTCLINSNRSPNYCNICLNLFEFSSRCSFVAIDTLWSFLLTFFCTTTISWVVLIIPRRKKKI